jgi:hypothetical protein
MRTDGATVGVVACGALATDISEIVGRRQWPVDVHPLPPLLHNHPERIAPEVEQTLIAIRDRYERVAVAYADCGTYGALDQLCDRYGIERLPGSDCYSVYAGTNEYQAMLDAEPGTYLLTDFLAASFQRSVMVELSVTTDGWCGSRNVERPCCSEPLKTPPQPSAFHWRWST